jgi:O-antigen ligase
MNCGGIVRIIAAIGFFLAPVGMLLTGNRGSFLASIVALSLVPLTLPRTRRSLYAVVLVILVVATTAIVVPALSWNRVLSTPQELRDGGDFGGRVAIWAAGFRVFEGRPLLGVGAGGFELAIYPVLGDYQGAHNTLLAVLVEQGIAGFSVFAALLGACWWIIRDMPGPERKFWAVLMLSWFVGGLSIHCKYLLTWLLFGLLAAQGGLPTGRRARAEQSRRVKVCMRATGLCRNAREARTWWPARTAALPALKVCC